MERNEWLNGYADRCVLLARFTVETGAPVREAAQKFGVSKSTVHKDLTEKLPYANPSLWQQVRAVLEKNKAERHLRGGEATRIKYLKNREEEEK